MRLFLAIELPEGQKRRLAELGTRRQWIGFGEGFRTVPGDNLHVTLKFLGEVPDERVGPVCDTLKGIAWPASLTLRTEGVTFFPPRGPISVFVARLGGDVEPLRELHARVEAALQPLGFAREGRPFTPHVTLLRADKRRKPKGALRQLVENSAPPPGEPFVVNSFVLFQSHLGSGGPEYVPLARFSG